MTRITKTDLDDRASTVNAMLRGLEVVPSGRYDYTALDLYQGGSLVRTLTTGTKREVYRYLGAMLDTLDMVGRDA